jgi:CubicO group peptidase (beta-lactamase class C family)
VVTAGGPQVSGRVAPGFELVAETFRRNFTEQQETGAAFSAFRDGQLIVDLWGGVADTSTRRPWAADTLQLIFSGTKGLVAVCLLRLIDSGRLSLDDRVSRHWPQFGAAGKEHVTVANLVSHRCRLPGLLTAVDVEDLLDDRHMARLLAQQPQLDDPRAGGVYHALTFGWLCGELIRQVDGRSVGRFFAEEIAGPLNLELWIGLPAEHEHRVCRLELADGWGPPQRPYSADADADADPLARCVWHNPPVFDRDLFPFNDPAVHAAQIAGVSAIGSARSVATLYGSLDRVLSADVQQLGRTQLSAFRDPLLNEQQAFGVGFQLQTADFGFGPPSDAFGHGGAGGSVHGAWPGERVGFSYAMNLMRDDADDRRAGELLTALHACVRNLM